MALSPPDLSISPVDILFAQCPTSAAGRSVAQHQHPHWQFEWLTAGRALAHVGDAEHRLTPGSGLLIPPDCPHGFRYDQDGTAWVSVKFSAALVGEADDDGSLPDHPATRLLAEAIATCVSAGGTVAAAAAPALQALLSLRDAVPRPSHGLIARIQALVAQDPLAAWRVDELAHAVGVTPGHCTTRFRAETGTALKAWLDRQRAEACVRLLRFADADITTIAAYASFPDVFTFSRFISRVTGQSPRTWQT